MAQHLCQTGALSLASAKRLCNMWKVDGVAVLAKNATCCSYHRHAEFMQQVAALIHYCSGDLAWAKVKLVSSIGI